MLSQMGKPWCWLGANEKETGRPKCAPFKEHQHCSCVVLILGLSMFVSLCWLFWLSVHLACLSIICLPLSCLCGRGPCFFILLSFSCLLVLFCPKLKFDNGGPRTEERLGPSTGPRPVEP